MITGDITFRAASLNERGLIHAWLLKPHVAPWFYGEGLKNTLDHLEEFFKGLGESRYWLACDKDRPFAFFITSHVHKPRDELSKWCVSEGEAITLDMLIGETDYLGKGLSPILIQNFLLKVFPQVDEVLIDPEVAHAQAIHVYKKAGFVTLGEFVPSYNQKPHLMMRLDLKKLY